MQVPHKWLLLASTFLKALKKKLITIFNFGQNARHTNIVLRGKMLRLIEIYLRKALSVMYMRQGSLDKTAQRKFPNVSTEELVYMTGCRRPCIQCLQLGDPSPQLMWCKSLSFYMISTVEVRVTFPKACSMEHFSQQGWIQNPRPR